MSTDTPAPNLNLGLYRKLQRMKWIALAGGLFLLGGGAYEYYRQTRILKERVRVAAKLVDSGTSAASKGKTVYRLTVDYRENEQAQTYRKEFAVPEKLYETTRQTRTVPVKFLPDDPGQSLIGDSATADIEPMLIGGTLVLCFVAITVYYRRKFRQIDRYILGE